MPPSFLENFWKTIFVLWHRKPLFVGFFADWKTYGIYGIIVFRRWIMILQSGIQAVPVSINRDSKSATLVTAVLDHTGVFDHRSDFDKIKQQIDSLALDDFCPTVLLYVYVLDDTDTFITALLYNLLLGRAEIFVAQSHHKQFVKVPSCGEKLKYHDIVLKESGELFLSLFS